MLASRFCLTQVIGQLGNWFIEQKNLAKDPRELRVN